MSYGVSVVYKDVNGVVLKEKGTIPCYASVLDDVPEDTRYLCSQPVNKADPHLVSRMVDLSIELFQPCAPSLDLKSFLSEAPYVELDIEKMNGYLAFALLTLVRLPAEFPRFLEYVEKRYEEYKDKESYLTIFTLSHDSALDDGGYRPQNHGMIPSGLYYSMLVDSSVDLIDLLKNNERYKEGSFLIKNLTRMGGYLNKSMYPYVKLFRAPALQSHNATTFDALYEQYKQGYPHLNGHKEIGITSA